VNPFKGGKPEVTKKPKAEAKTESLAPGPPVPIPLPPPVAPPVAVAAPVYVSVAPPKPCGMHTWHKHKTDLAQQFCGQCGVLRWPVHGEPSPHDCPK